MTVAFKEWVLVCQALGRGEQSVLMRKGGIAEGVQGFGFEHPEFYLFPTWFHAQVEKVRGISVLPERDADTITLEHAVKVEWSKRVTDFAAVQRLSPLHILHESVIEERFHYDGGQPLRDEEGQQLSSQGIHVAFIRVYRLEPAVMLPMEQSFGGCRSWIELPEIAPSILVSVLSNEEQERRKALFCELLGVRF